MPRIRSVHPDICTDEVLAGLSGDVERCYVRLWTHLDDEGRCVDNPLLIKAALFPLVEWMSYGDVDGWLAELATAGLIRRYEVDGRRYLTTKPEAWARWQKPRRRVESKLPPPPVAPVPDIVRTPPDIDGQRPPVGVGGEGGGGETETKKEGESEGETDKPAPETPSVDNPTPLALRLVALEASPPEWKGSGLGATGPRTSSSPDQAGLTALPIDTDAKSEGRYEQNDQGASA